MIQCLARGIPTPELFNLKQQSIKQKTMKQISFLLLGLCMAAVLQAQPVKEHGQLQVKGTQLSDAAGSESLFRNHYSHHPRH